MADLRRAAVPLALAALAVALLAPGLVAGPSLDAAVFVHVAERMRSGEALYLDAWDHKPPGVYLIYAAGQAILPFLDGWLLAWILSVAATTLAALGVDRLLDRCDVPPVHRLGAAAVTVVVAAQYLTALGGGLTEPMATALLAWACVVAMTRPTWGGHLAVGALAAAAVLISIPAVAGSFVVSVAAILGSTRKVRAGATVVAGGVVPVALVAGWLAATGSLVAAVDAIVGYAVAYRAANASLGAALSAPVASWTLLALLFAIVPAALGLVQGVATAGVRRRVAITAGSWIGLAVMLFFSQGRFFAHYAIPLAVPLGILAGFGLERVFARRRLRSIVAAAVAVSLAAGIVAGSMEWTPVQRQHERVERVAQVVDELTEPTDRIWVWGAAPQLYLAADRDSATRFSYLYPLVTLGFTTEADIDAAVEALESEPPMVIVDAGSDQPGAPGLQELLEPRPLATDGRDLDILDPLRGFVSLNYAETMTVDGWIVYRRAVVEGRS